jgi:hypothetical protein
LSKKKRPLKIIIPPIIQMFSSQATTTLTLKITYLSTSIQNTQLDSFKNDKIPFKIAVDIKTNKYC